MPHAHPRQINAIFFTLLAKLVFLPVFLFVALIFFASPTFAATFTVNSTTDAVDASPGNGSCATAGSVCTLRAAIQEANALSGADTITLPAGTYTLSIAGINEDTSATGDLDITSDITINGADEATTIIDANNIDRVIEMSSAPTVSISNLTVKNGNIDSFEGGGGINNYDGGDLTLDHVTISNNTTTNSGDGGGIYNSGGATLTNVTIKNNASAGRGGGIYSSSLLITISNSVIDTNTAMDSGGGIHVDQSATLTNVTVSNNTADYGGGIYFNGTGTLTNVVLSGNNATLEGGGAYVSYVTTFTKVTINGNTASSGGGIYINVSAFLENVTISGNTATAQGGGIDNNYPSYLTNVTIAENTAPSGKGAGLYVESDIFAANSIFASNTSGNCSFAGSTITSQGHNLSSDSSCSSDLNQSGDLNSTNPVLSSLANNGGYVKTHALQAGSPAIDAADNTYCPATDARGLIRTSSCDIGAFELNATTPPTSVTTDDFTTSYNTDPIDGNFVVEKDVFLDNCDGVGPDPDQGNLYSWDDGGNDAFDSFGCPTVQINGVSQALPLYNSNNGVLTTDTYSVGGTDISVKQGWLNTNMYMLHIEKTGGTDQNATFRMDGNMGSDSETAGSIKSFVDEGYLWNFCRNSDSEGSGEIFSGDPIVYIATLSPKASQSQDNICSWDQDYLTAMLQNSPLPITVYISWGYMQPNVFSTWVKNDWYSTTTLTPNPTSTSSSSPSSSSSNSTSGPPSCGDTKPSSTPDLFQIDTTSTSATLYIAPVAGANKYAVVYGYSSGENRFGTEFSYANASGVIPIEINALAPNTSYYFKVRAGNGCMPGEFGNELKATTTKKGSTQTHQFFKGFLSRFTNLFSKKSNVIKTTSTTSANTRNASCSYTVQAGDSLWSIAASTMGSGAKYPTIIQLNKTTFPTLSPTSILRIGWKVKVC